MNLLATDIEGVMVLRTETFADERGSFSEIYSKKVLPVSFVQENESVSVHGVLRGLHFQKPPYSQAKLVRCMEGRIVDVAVDMRKGSPTFGRHVRIELSAENRLQLFIPAGFAHGFSVLSQRAVVLYRTDEFYHPEAEGGISALDPCLGIDWGLDGSEIIMKEKDRTSWPVLNEYETPFNY